MSIERIYRCDGPECERNQSGQAQQEVPFLTITGHGSAMHFCSWDCVLKRAATYEPSTVMWADGDES